MKRSQLRSQSLGPPPIDRRIRLLGVQLNNSLDRLLAGIRVGAPGRTDQRQTLDPTLESLMEVLARKFSGELKTISQDGTKYRRLAHRASDATRALNAEPHGDPEVAEILTRVAIDAATMTALLGQLETQDLEQAQ